MLRTRKMWRKGTIITLALLLILSLLPISFPALAIAEGEELSDSLLNGSFEDVQDGKPLGWTLATGDPGDIESSTEEVHSGTYSVKLVDESDAVSTSVRSNKIRVEVGEKYETSVFSYNLEGVSELYLEFWDEDDNYLDILTGRNSTLSEWGQIHVRGTAPEGAVYATIRLYLHKANVGTAYFDDATFGMAALDPAPNLANSSFELISDGKPKYWQGVGGTVELSDGRKYDGSYSVKLTDTGTSDSGGLRSHMIPVVPETDYEAGVFAYVKTGMAEFHLEFWDEDHSLLSTSASGSAAADEWEEITVSEVAPAEAVYASLRLGIDPDQGGSAYFDNAMFTRTGEVTSNKTRATYYTAEERETARENVKNLNWAKSLRDEAVRKADQYLDKGLDFLWEAVPAQTLPRSYGVNQELGSPITGREIDKYGNYPYKADPLNEPWKIVDPSSGYKFPTNDFGAYYESGLDEHGVFRPELADDQYLVNELYPEKGPDWGVDNGFGWVDENGDRYTFIAYYVHWFSWYGTGMIQETLEALRDAYLYTGDIRYAQAGTILLDRVADVYPEMDVSEYDSTVYLNSHGGTGEGKVVGSIWETNLAKVFISAYDAFYPAMDDPQIIQFLQEKAEQYRLTNPKKSATDIRHNIEEGIIKQIYPGVKAAQIRGNDGMHQSALAMAAVVYDTMPETKEWLDFTFQTGGLERNPWRVTGGNILNSLVTNVDRDGHGNEASPGYNALWLDQHQITADILDGYDGYPEADLYNNVKFRKMFSAMYPLTLIERYTPHIGDTGSTGNPLIMPKMQDMVKAFDKFGDPVYAQLAYFLNNNRADGIHKDVFSEEPEAISDHIQTVIDEHGTLNLKSDNLAGYGFAALRDGVNIGNNVGILYGFPEMEVADSNTPTKVFDDSGTVQLEANEVGATIAFNFEVPKTDEYDIDLLPFKAPTYGIYRISIDGHFVKDMDFFGSRTDKFETLATMALEAGTHQISFEGVGKNPDSGNYKMGVRVLNLLDAEAREIRDNLGAHGNTLRDIWMYYGRNRGHGHADTLNLGVHAFGLDLAPDLGYPEFADAADMHRAQWVNNTISHNTVVVDKRKQEQQWVAEPKHFDDGEWVKLIDVEAPKVYPQTELYKRTTAMIKVDETNSYTVDFFRVKGGGDHHFSFHGAEGTVSTEGLDLVEQPTGTYAGPDVEYGERVDDVEGPGYMGSGFHYLKNVERDEAPADSFSVDWEIVDTWNVLEEDEDIHLRLTMLGDVDEVALADGVPPQNKPGNPETLRYFIAHRHGENLDSVFTSVIEPYKGNRYIESIEPASVTVDGEEISNADVRAVKVTLKNGRVDYIVSALDPNILYTVDDIFDFQGIFGVYSEKDGEPIYGYLNGGAVLGDTVHSETNALTGTVVDFTKDLSIENEIVVDLDQSYENLNELVGSYIYVETDGERNGAYRIEGIKEQDGTRVTFDFGDITLVRSYADPEDFNQGFIYNIAEGADGTIPLSIERERITTSMLLETLDEYKEDIPEEVYRALKIHLTAVSRFEQQNAAKKVVKHMGGFKRLLDHQKDGGQISEDLYSKLKSDADGMLTWWQ